MVSFTPMDIIAGILEIYGLYLIGDKLRAGFLCNIAAMILWVVVSVQTGLYGLLAVGLVCLYLNIRNWRKWRE